MRDNRCDRVAGVVWSVYAHELGVDTDEAQLWPHACILRPALRALSLGQPLDDWSLVGLPPRTFYALVAAVDVLRAEVSMRQDGLVSLWCRYNVQALADQHTLTSPAGLPWVVTIGDARNAAIVLGGMGGVDLGELELLAEQSTAPFR